jgi:hypothetical protein
MSGEVFRRGADGKPDWCDPPRNQARVAHSSDAHPDVEFSLEQVHHAIID